MKMNLEKGDPCFVRINTGEVVEAKYDGVLSVKHKSHEVTYCGVDLIATHYHILAYSKNECVFQYPVSEMKRQMGLQ